jgi:pimeloyl-ACP methyl ester carboxylesterase
MANDKPKPDQNPDGTRRIAMRFDANGDPILASCKSPDSHKQRALCMEPPRDVIPVVFVPGIAGTNLRLGEEAVWKPPNGKMSGLGAAASRKSPDLRELQRLWDPEKTEVDPRGDCKISDKTYWLTTAEAQRRGWGAVHALSYHEFLQKLEMTLNDQYVVTDKSAFLLPEIGLLQYLKGDCPARTREEKAAGKPDYAKDLSATLKAWGRTPQPPQPLSAAEIRKLEDYYYPVWAAGYNWLGDPERAASGLLERIDTILKSYEKSKYFRHQGKVILITHSMGGLIARRAAQMDESKILGVVHGVCPLVGAAVFYRRMRSGQEGGSIEEDVTAAIMGNRQREMTVQIGRSPGALSLAPTRDYPSDWLRVYASDKENKDDLLFSLPKADPYTEIYSKTTDDVWWGMVDPSMLDPMEVMVGDDTPSKRYKNAVALAKEFHDKLKLYAHPETYGIYGTDNNKYRSFGHVSWLCATSGEPILMSGDYQFLYFVPKDYLKKLFSDQKKRDRIKELPKYSHVSGKHSRGVGAGKITGLDFSGWGYAADEWGNNVRILDSFQWREVPRAIQFVLTSERNMNGDGTVPACSGEMLKKLTPPLKEVFAIPGYGHQGAFDDDFVFRATIYSIARIVQKAQAPKKS